jgi:hypothetical protein
MQKRSASLGEPHERSAGQISSVTGGFGENQVSSVAQIVDWTRLLDTLGRADLKKRWDELHARRSTLVHGLAPVPGVNDGPLANEVMSRPGARRYATLDDLDTLDAARRDPEVLVGGPGAVTLDEVQREPELLRAVKRAIDRDRKPGRFLLTGSEHFISRWT